MLYFLNKFIKIIQGIISLSGTKQPLMMLGHTNPSENETLSSVLRSTLSSRAKQATANKVPNTGSASNKSSNRGVIKVKITEGIALTGKKPMHSLTDSIPPPKRKIFLTKSNEISRKSSRNDSSTVTVMSKTFKKDTKLPSSQVLGVKGRNSQDVSKSRAPSTARSSNATKETDCLKSQMWQRNRTCSTLMLSKNPYNDSKETGENRHKIVSPPIEMAVQTNEKEILNHSLVVGDIKYLKPSLNVVNEIEKQRKELKTKQLLKATRKFEAHSEKQEEHLNDLKEFLEKSYVTKKERKARDSTEEEQK